MALENENTGPSQQWGHWKIPWVLRASQMQVGLLQWTLPHTMKFGCLYVSSVSRGHNPRLQVTTQKPLDSTRLFDGIAKTSNIVSTPNAYQLRPPSSIPTPDSWRAVETVCSVLLETTPRIMPAWPQKVCFWVRVSRERLVEKKHREISWNFSQIMEAMVLHSFSQI